MGVDALSQRDTVGEILGRGHDERGRREISGVDVDGPAGRAPLFPERFLERDGPDLQEGQPLRGDQGFEAQEAPPQALPHLGPVVIRQIERERRALAVDPPPLRFKTSPGLAAVRILFIDHAADAFDRCELFRLGHSDSEYKPRGA